MRPKPIPPLTEKQFAELQKEMERKPSGKDLERIKRARETFKRYPI